MAERLTIREGGIHVQELHICSQHVADFLSSIPVEDHEARFIEAVEVGAFCLERARNTLDTDFIRRQVDSLMAGVERAVQSIPERTRDAVMTKVGTNEGQVLQPIQALVTEVSNTISGRVKEVRELFAQEIDPSRDGSTLGRALRTLLDLVDSKRTDSVQGLIAASVEKVTSQDGALAKAVRAVVAEAVEPLAREVNRLALEIRGQEAAEEAIAQTIEKGMSFEDEVVEAVREWAQVAGAEVYHVGVDNKAGDVVVATRFDSMTSTPIRIVVEARDRQAAMGRKAISDTLRNAMAERAANASIFVSRNRAGLANEIGEWAEGECELGPFVACTQDHLNTGLRFLIVQSRLSALRRAEIEVDSARLEAQLQRVRTSLDRVKTINRKITEVRGSANDIQTEAETLRDEIRGALTMIEDAMKAISIDALATAA